MENDEARRNSREARYHNRQCIAAPLNPNSSSAAFSAKLQTLPILNNASNSSSLNPLLETRSYTLRGAPRSFDSIDSDNERRPRGLWHDFLQSFDPLELQSSESKDRTLMEAGATSVEFKFAPVNSSMTSGLEFPLFESKSQNDGIKGEGQGVFRTPRSATAPPPPEKREHYYSMDYSNDYERRLLDRFSSSSSIGRKNAGRSKERRIRSLPQALLTTSQSTRKTGSDPELEWRVETHVEPSFTDGVLPKTFTGACPIHKASLEDGSEEGLGDDSAKASGSFIARFQVVVVSEMEHRDEMEPDSASSFESRMAEACREAQLDQNANSRSCNFVRKVAGTSDRKRVTRLNKEHEKRTELEKPNRLLYSWLCSSPFNSVLRSP